MINDTTKDQAIQLAKTLKKDELIWLSGYFYGLSNNQLDAQEPQANAINIAKDISIIYITETGNCKFLSNELGKYLKNSGSKIKIKSSIEYRLNDLSKESNLIIITSTHGEGEIPKAGEKFFEHIKKCNDLENLNYLVIALGDTSYPLFCKAGVDIDNVLESKKAKRLADTIKLNLDFEEHIQSLFDTTKNLFSDQSITPQDIATNTTKPHTNNFKGIIATNVNLNDINSSKQTHHIEITTDNELHYEPGDCIAIQPKSQGKEKITPRLYSIASSLNEHGNEVHIIVAVLSYKDEKGKIIKGLASNYLANLKEGDEIEFHISKNRIFKLPTDDKDIIMIGPGTGIAPFRAFMAERNYRSANGKNWLLFGDRNFKSDFLYQIEWQDYLSSNLLTKMDVAFSRDSDKKVYVQHKLKENSKEVFEWLENGAYVYVCGDKDNMAKDVHDALVEIIRENKPKCTKKQAIEYLDALTSEERYLRDVY